MAPEKGGDPPKVGRIPLPVLLNGKTVTSAKVCIAVFREIFKRIHTENLLIRFTCDPLFLSNAELLQNAVFCYTGIYEKSPKLLNFRDLLAVRTGLENFRDLLAVRTGLEPATSGVTGRHSNQAELPHRFLYCPLRFRKGLQRYTVFVSLQTFFKKITKKL